jgi:hypothetical protein
MKSNICWVNGSPILSFFLKKKSFVLEPILSLVYKTKLAYPNLFGIEGFVVVVYKTKLAVR